MRDPLATPSSLASSSAATFDAPLRRTLMAGRSRESFRQFRLARQRREQIAAALQPPAPTPLPPAPTPLPPHAEVHESYDEHVRERAAASIQGAFRRWRDRRRFARVLASLRSAESSVTVPLLRRINPREAELLADRVHDAFMRFRLDGRAFPPRIVYKIFSQTRRITIDGASLYRGATRGTWAQNPVSRSDNWKRLPVDVRLDMPKRSPDHDSIRRSLVQHHARVDKVPVLFGGMGNTWRGISESNGGDGRVFPPAPHTARQQRRPAPTSAPKKKRAQSARQYRPRHWTASESIGKMGRFDALNRIPQLSGAQVRKAWQIKSPPASSATSTSTSTVGASSTRSTPLRRPQTPLDELDLFLESPSAAGTLALAKISRQR